MTPSPPSTARQGTKHSKISRQLIEDIVSGKYAPGSRLPTEAELVQLFEVSRPTVSQALRDLQNRGLVTRRPGSGTYVLRTESKPAVLRQLGLLVPGIRMTGIFEAICADLANLARSKNYFLVWGGTNYSTAPTPEHDRTQINATELCEQFISQQVNGVFFAPFELTEEHQEEASEKICRRFTEAKIPLVLIDRDFTTFPKRSNFDLVTVDNVEGGFLLADHLIRLGCKRLAFVCRPNSATTVTARMAGVREALARHNLTENKGWIKIGDPNEEDFVRTLASEKWDGVVCANDLTAAHLMRTLKQINVRVPHDIRVVGFDDAKFATLLSPSLTTVHQPTQNLAITAFHAMLDRIETPNLPARCSTLSPELIVRESCGSHAESSAAR